MEKKEQKKYSATGRRKESVARVKLIPEATGAMKVNGKEIDSYFTTVDSRNQAKRPLIATELDKKVDVEAKVTGGGLSGQAGSISLGIARCLIDWRPELKAVLKEQSFLTRDPRAKERKKYGRKGARKRFQWTKR
ncbi:MAG: 30S ribosomal protein S9 [Candidatus Omnitrophica bacterium]|nr:30S ribosomal protein S9 [Candidatus Omnitrophota bacterium]MCF7877481.1 30S ribosomal protein S9 [Candidatus Omnitrophota bacterium]MCF7891537.1 30S ribosomal protein S9 [Candidatus Omnitrophota bacterium]MCF7897351.1 30S ribosomal protein S9 [Candidatus Omnitrophota bacterium]MCF7909679.1 30S ribosomal protein S9 [Candidatus Omnitrophota bacterium]